MFYLIISFWIRDVCEPNDIRNKGGVLVGIFSIPVATLLADLTSKQLHLINYDIGTVHCVTLIAVLSTSYVGYLLVWTFISWIVPDILHLVFYCTFSLLVLKSMQV